MYLSNISRVLYVDVIDGYEIIEISLSSKIDQYCLTCG